MVIRLGQTSDLTLLNSQRYRILQGQALQLQYASDVVATVRAWARVRYDNGEDSLLFIPDAVLVSDRVPALCPPSDVARYDGWVTDALVELPLASDSVKRGQVYIRLFLDPFGTVLCSDYVHSTFGQVTLGTYIQPGPGGGAGNLHVQTVKAIGAPAAATQLVLRLSNTIRKFTAMSWFYESSNDVATRNLDVNLHRFLGDSPTGMGSASLDYWHPAQLVLTADQDGCLFADTERSGNNDVSTIAIDSEPTPFPLWVTEDYPAGSLITFDVANLNVNDEDSIYLLVEDWIVL